MDETRLTQLKYSSRLQGELLTCKRHILNRRHSRDVCVFLMSSIVLQCIIH